jgi:hypothetical protein
MRPNPVDDEYQLTAIVQRGRAGLDDLAAKQRERAAVWSLELIADRFVSVPQATPRRAGEHHEAASDPSLLWCPEAVRDSIHLTTSQLDAVLHLSVMLCTLCIHHYLEVLTRSVRCPRIASDTRVTERHRLAALRTRRDLRWLSSGSANYRAGFQ